MGLCSHFVILHINLDIVDSLTMSKYFFNIEIVSCLCFVQIARRQKRFICKRNQNLCLSVAFLTNGSLQNKFTNLLRRFHTGFGRREIFLTAHFVSAIEMIETCASANNCGIIVNRNFVINIVLCNITMPVTCIRTADQSAPEDMNLIGRIIHILILRSVRRSMVRMRSRSLRPTNNIRTVHRVFAHDVFHLLSCPLCKA